MASQWYFSKRESKIKKCSCSNVVFCCAALLLARKMILLTKSYIVLKTTEKCKRKIICMATLS